MKTKKDRLTLWMLLCAAVPLFNYTVYLCCAGQNSMPVSALVLFCVLAPPALCLLFGRRLKKRLPRLYSALRGAYIFIGALYSVSFIVFSVWVSAGTNASEDVEADVYIVLGSRAKGWEPSWSLKLRLDRSLELLNAHPDSVAVLTGGRGEDETVPEAEVMFRYLTEAGIAPERLYSEKEATDTEENITLSFNLLLPLGLEDKKIAVVSNTFHIKRAVLMAAEQGFTLIPCAAETPFGFRLISYMTREYMSYIKWKIT